MSVTEQQRDALVERLFAAGLGMAEVLTVYLGDTLGLYRALRQSGAMTAPELAKEAGILPRYAREWLEQQAAGGIVTVDDASAEPDERRYELPEGHVEPLLDPESPYAIAGFCKSFVAVAGVMPELVSAFRSGGPVPWDAYGRDMIEAQGDFNRWWLLGSFATEYLPSIPDLHERLSSGAKVADVACGVGWAAISLARAYPNVTVDGFDLDEPSIELARRNAAEAGVADRVTFETRDAADPALRGAYDFATVIEAIHDLSQPVAVLGAIREMLKPGGTLIVADERDRGRVHGTRERDRAALLRLQRPVLPALGDGRPVVRGDRHRHAPRRRSRATRSRRGSTRSRSCRSSTTSSASTGSTGRLPG